MGGGGGEGGVPSDVPLAICLLLSRIFIAAQRNLNSLYLLMTQVFFIATKTLNLLQKRLMLNYRMCTSG